MIKNRRQYQVALDQMNALAEALNAARVIAGPDVFVKAHIMALESELASLEAEIDEYDRLQSQPYDPAFLQRVERLGQDLIRARIASKLTHKDLALALGKKEQAIQRLEANDYKTASLATIASIANVIAKAQRVA